MTHEGINEIRAWAQSTRLTDAQQAEIIDRSVEVMDTIERMGKDRAALAKSLIAIRKVLKPHKLWDKWLRLHAWNRYGISRTTAHRVIDAYVDRKAINPTPAIQSAMVSPAKKGPIPVPAPAKGRWRGEISAQQCAAETFRHWKTRIDHVSGRKRMDSLRELVGAQLAHLGVSGSVSFEAAAMEEAA